MPDPLDAASAEPKQESAVSPPIGGDDRIEAALRAYEAAGGDGATEAEATPTGETPAQEQGTPGQEAAPVQHEAAAVEPKAATPEQVKEEKAERLKAVQATAAAVRAQRRADIAKKEAKKALQEKAEWEASKAQWKADPDQLLAASGLTPEEFLDARLRKQLAAPDPDPLEIRAKQILAPHLKALEDERDQLTAQQQQMATANVMARQVLPIVTQQDNGAPKYESLLAYCGDDPNRATVYVFNVAQKHFEETGQAVPFHVVADYLEGEHAKAIESSLTRASNMNKFRSRFSSGNGASTEQGTRPTPTLTNKHGPAITPGPIANAISASKPKAPPSDLDMLIKKHGFDRAL